MKTISQIKNELRFIKKSNLAIEAHIATETRLKKRLAWLEHLGNAPTVRRDIAGTRRTLKRIVRSADIQRLNNLESSYLKYIQKLDDEYDKLLLTKVYIEGQTFNSVARQLGYSSDALKKRAARALRKLRNIINNKV